MVTELGKFLRIYRITKGIKTTEMAERMHMSVTMISYIELGKRTPSKEFIEAFIKEFNLTNKEQTEFNQAFQASLPTMIIDLTDMSKSDKELMWLLKEKLLSLKSKDKAKIKRILESDIHE